MIKGADTLAYPSRLTSEEPPTSSSCAAGRLGDGHAGDWASIEVDLDIVRHTRSNLLVIGSGDLVVEIISWITRERPVTVVNASECGRLPLSHLWPASGALVLRDVDALDAEAQVLLFDWLERGSSGRQIVSTSSTPLLPLVRAGTFLEGLYYRLNIVSIRLGAEAGFGPHL